MGHTVAPFPIYERDHDGCVRATSAYVCCGCRRLMTISLDGLLTCTRTPAPYAPVDAADPTCFIRGDQPVSPWVRNAIAGTLPASDRTGTVRA